jgi:hypothetical protein
VHLGDLRVPPSAALITGANDFAEYFGPRTACDDVPSSLVNWGYPTFDGGAGVASFDSSPKSSCTGGEATQTALADGSRAR